MVFSAAGILAAMDPGPNSDTIQRDVRVSIQVFGTRFALVLRLFCGLHSYMCSVWSDFGTMESVIALYNSATLWRSLVLGVAGLYVARKLVFKALFAAYR